MESPNILKKPGIASALTILLLLSSYIFTFIYNNNPVSEYARMFLFLIVLFLALFLIGFAYFALSLFNMEEVRMMFSEPGNMSVVASLLLICSYLATVMHEYVVKIYGELHTVTTIFFYLGITFFILFIISFLALIVSVTNKFFFSRA